jgi:hypothetical protein
MSETDPATAAAADPAPAAAALRPEPGDGSASALVWSWFNDRIANSPASRDVAGLNHLRAELDGLAARLDAALFQKG